MSLASLMAAVQVITGVIMWWNRTRARRRTPMVGRTPPSAADALVGLLRAEALISLARSGSRGPARTRRQLHH